MSSRVKLFLIALQGSKSHHTKSVCCYTWQHLIGQSFSEITRMRILKQKNQKPTHMSSWSYTENHEDKRPYTLYSSILVQFRFHFSTILLYSSFFISFKIRQIQIITTSSTNALLSISHHEERFDEEL